MQPDSVKVIKQVSADGYHTCILTDKGITCLGDNTFGQVNVPDGLKNPRQITAGVNHTCALTDDGVKCWGDNEAGQKMFRKG